MFVHAKRSCTWPKVPPVLTPEQIKAKEGFMKGWHEILETKYQLVERFNHGWTSKLPHKAGSRTLEIGAGLGGHLPYENLADQDYFCLEMRPAFCERLAQRIRPDHVLCADIQKSLPLPDAQFDRIIAIHVLEHLTHLPDAITEVKRLLKPDGVFDVVLPTQGGLAYRLASMISGERYFRKTFKMDYQPIFKTEHVNDFPEIISVLDETFRIEKYQYFPLFIPLYHINICVGFRLRFKNQPLERK
jgi:SAM-dependent methyltransferase